jgi:hypothetical protein
LPKVEEYTNKTSKIVSKPTEKPVLSPKLEAADFLNKVQSTVSDKKSPGKKIASSELAAEAKKQTV